VAAFLACGGAQTGSKANSDDAVLLIRVAPKDTSIWVDGNFVAEVAQAPGGVAVNPGKHRIELRHDRFHSHYQIVELKPREKRIIAVELAEDLP